MSRFPLVVLAVMIFSLFFSLSQALLYLACTPPPTPSESLHNLVFRAAVLLMSLASIAACFTVANFVWPGDS